MSHTGGPVQWVKYLLLYGSKKEKKKKLGILFTFWWLIWRERNNRIFEDKHRSVPQLIKLIQDSLKVDLPVLCPSIS
jgi:hypothetical protein